MTLDIIQLLALALYEHSHIKENLMQLHQVLLHLLYRIVPFLNLHDRVHHLSSPLLLNSLLQKQLALPCLYQVIQHFLIWILTRYCVVSSSQQPN